jgi:hypothetical protein
MSSLKTNSKKSKNAGSQPLNDKTAITQQPNKQFYLGPSKIPELFHTERELFSSGKIDKIVLEYTSSSRTYKYYLKNVEVPLSTLAKPKAVETNINWQATATKLLTRFNVILPEKVSNKEQLEAFVREHLDPTQKVLFGMDNKQYKAYFQKGQEESGKNKITEKDKAPK